MIKAANVFVFLPDGPRLMLSLNQVGLEAKWT